MEPSENLEVDSVIDLQLPVNVDVSVEAETVGEQHAPGSVAGSGVEPLRRAETSHPGVAGAGRRGLPQSDVAGAGECYEHVGRFAFNKCRRYNSQRSEAGAHWHS